MSNKLILALILSIGLILRLHQVNSFPALNADEAAIAYNSYSLLQTGRDEHGNRWPLEFQSFNDYKPGGYFYLTLPFIKILGLSTLAVRLPNIILSIFSIFLIYLLANHLFLNTTVSFRKWTLNPGHLASLLLAISPWHIHFSRGAWEVNAATAMFLFAVVALLKNRLLLSLSAFFLAMYTYHSMRLIVPIFLAGSWFLFSNQYASILKNRKKTFLYLLLFAILTFPLVRGLLGKTVSARFSGVGLTADRGPVSRAEELRLQHADWNGIFIRVAHNKYLEYGLRLADNYTRHFSGNFLFVEGDEIQRNKIPGMGLLYFFEIVTVAVGLVSLLKNPNSKSKTIWLWLLVAPIASSLTFQSPHALRAQNMTIPLTLISTLGIMSIIKLKKTFVLLMFSAFALWNIGFYLHQYYNHLAPTYPYSSQYGFKELISYIDPKLNEYNQVFISPRYDQPYILTLFYLKYDPGKFQQNHQLSSRDAYGFSTVPHFDKFYFTVPDWDGVPPKSLIAVSPEESPQNISPIETINFPNGSPAFKIYSL